MYEIFQKVSALSAREKKQHVRLHDRLYAVFSRLDASRVEDFLTGDLKEEIGGDIAQILSRYPIADEELEVVYDMVDDAHNIMAAALEDMWHDEKPQVEWDRYILECNNRLTGAVLSCFYPLLKPGKVSPDRLAHKI